jgi:hypothetical protein
MHLKKFLPQSLALALVAAMSPALFAAAITASVSPVGPITVGATFTVTLSMASYTGSDEIDGFEFKVTYPTGLFSLVAGSESLHDAASFGIDENWLRKAPQDLVGAGGILTDGTTSSTGTVNVSVSDLRGGSSRGTTSSAGFLYSFDLMATGVGSGFITPSTPATGVVLYDVSLSGVSPNPTFTGVPMTVVPEPALVGLLAAGGGVLLGVRRRRR